MRICSIDMISFFPFQFDFDCKEAQEDYQYFQNIHRIKVFLDRVTHTDTVFRHPLFENKGARPKKDAFQIYFVAAGTSTTSDSKCFFSNNVTSNFFSLLENGACRPGYTPSSWCNVKIENLFSLERLKESLVNNDPDLSLVHNYSICMDGTVAKSLFNTICNFRHMKLWNI